MTRDEKIKLMVEDDLRMVRDNGNSDDWLVDILLTGFVGYQNQSEEEINAEFDERLLTE